MSYSVTYTSIQSLKKIIFHSSKPEHGLKILTKDIEEGFKVMKLTCQKDLLLKMKKYGDAPVEVQNRAKKLISKYNNRRVKFEEKRIMRYRIAEKEKELRISKRKWAQFSDSAENFLDRNSVFNEEFKVIKKNEVSRVFNIEKEIKEGKLRKRVVNIPEVFAGIKVGDTVLNDEYGDPNVEPVILGGIEPSDNMKAFMNLPVKFRVYDKIDKDEYKVQTEVTAAKERWGYREMEENGDEDNNTRATRRELENRAREPLQNGELDFTKLRVTQLACNKVIYMPPAANDRAEMLKW